MRRYKRIYVRFLKEPELKRAVLNQARKEKNIVYGAQSIKKRVGPFSRGTYDYDIFSSRPKKSAKNTEKKFDSLYGYDNFYVKPAMHPGTWKVMDKGFDDKQNTEDDFGVVDYTQMPKPTPKFDVINGVRYRKISLERQAKMKAIKDPAFAYRHKKDKEDLARMDIADGKI